MNKRFSTALVLMALVAFGVGEALAQGGPPRRGGGGFGIVPMLVQTDAYPDGGIIPDKYSMYGGSTMPGFKITAIPDSAKSMAVIFHDLDVAAGNNPEDNLHWMAWNIPVSGTTLTIEEGKLPQGATSKGMGGAAFMGPGAPYSPRYHHYIFEFYALSEPLDLPATAGRPELLEAMKGKVVAKAAYAGRFRAAEGQGFGGGPPRGGPPPAR